jgi:hypothetical protein
MPKQMLTSQQQTMSESFSPSPRKRLNQDIEGEADPDPAVKRLKLENVDEPTSSPNFLPTPTRFLSFHLQLLRALYNNDSDNDNYKSSETNVEDVTWEMTSRYLQQRETMKSMTQKANHCSGIHEEALYVLDQEPAMSPAWATRAIIPPQPPSIMNNSTMLTSSTSQHSPHTPRYPTQTTGITAGGDSHQSFRVVASLLGRKSRMATARLQQQIKPFRPLVTAVERRLALLDQLARQQQQQQTALKDQDHHHILSSTSSTETQVAGNILVQQQDMDESLARIETKRRLWSILLQDLKHCA